MTENRRICKETGKKCYSKREAQATIHSFHRNHSKYKRHKKNDNIPCRSYYCEYCGCYHLTHWKTYYNKDKMQKIWR